MYNDHFRFRESPFSVTPDPQFFYSNTVYRGALSTLRYGIETGKGFIVITGEAGTGKTMLLRKVRCGFAFNIKAAYIFNTLVSFTELLRLILSDLGLRNNAQDSSAMVRQLHEYLIEQSNAGHVVALLIDEAQNLSLEMLEELRLLSNLETDQDKLLQIVLMGQPELERKLDQPELFQLKQRVALRYRIESLGTHEVGSYIDSRLKTVSYRNDQLFDPESIKKIAIYSKGIPRLINIICDNALIVAHAASALRVSGKMIDEVARDLLMDRSRVEMDTWVPTPKRPQQKKAALESAQAEKDDFMLTGEPFHSDSEYFLVGTDGQPIASDSDKERHVGWRISALFIVVTLTGLGVLLYLQPSGFSFPILASYFDILIGNGPEDIKQAELPGKLEVKASKIEPPRNLPAPLNLATAGKNQNKELVRLPESTKEHDVSPQALSTPEERFIDRRNALGGHGKFANRSGAIKTPKESTLAGEMLEAKIYKAISDRAIEGVEVSVRGGTVYLRGRVATRRQKFAALQAARGVPGVEEVRDGIIVSWLTPRGSG